MKTKRIAVVMAAAMLLAVSPVEAGGRQIFSSVCVNAADNSSVSEKNEKMWLLKTYYRPNWEKGHDLGYNITYDKNGRISKITFVTYDSHNEEYDKKREYSVYKEIKIIYEKNNILNYIVEGEEYKNKYSVKYNDMGLITAVNGIRAYEYDEDGNAVEKKLKNSIANKYDKNGKLIYSKETSSYYITQNWYSYDESGRLTHKTWKQVNRETARENIGSTNYKYDENG
ncbi:MAG: hypothetical protein J6A37_14285, partial [Oscillospiraceae bacterium]|nr:hypothetical protein [Oscillospiraceae bacterium]